MSNNIEKIETLTHRNLMAYLMEAGQDISVRYGMVYDGQGHALAKVEARCCATCLSCKRVEMWGVVRHVCGDPTLATCIDVMPDACCKFYEGPDVDLGLTMDIWY